MSLTAVVRLRWWESVLLFFPGGVCVLLLLAGRIAAGVVLAAAVVVLAASRAEIVERNVAGGYARARALPLMGRWVALLAVHVTALWLFFLMYTEHWTRGRHGTVVLWALVGLAIFLAREIYRVGEEAGGWLHGSGMEREVARVLDSLRPEGWLIAHDVEKERGGNVGHFVTGPSGAFAIETKSGRARAADRNHAIRNAVWARETFGERWVTAVLCVGTDPPAGPEQHGYAWVVGRDDLVDFLRNRAGTDPARAPELAAHRS